MAFFHDALYFSDDANLTSFVPNHLDDCASALLTQNVIYSVLGEDCTWATSPPAGPCSIQATGVASSSFSQQ